MEGCIVLFGVGNVRVGGFVSRKVAETQRGRFAWFWNADLTDLQCKTLVCTGFDRFAFCFSRKAQKGRFAWFFLTAKVAKEVAEGTKDASLFFLTEGNEGTLRLVFLTAKVAINKNAS